MLRVARRPALRGAGSLRPRKEGPLIECVSSATGVVVRGVSAGCGLGGALVMGAGGAVRGGVGWAGAAAGSANSDAPHIPQKRFCSEFSFPQRGQRNQSSPLYSLRYLTGSLQVVGASAILRLPFLPQRSPRKAAKFAKYYDDEHCF